MMLSNPVCYRLSLFVQNKRRLIDQKMKDFGLCRTQWRLLLNFNYLEPPVTQKRLLCALDIDAAHLTRTLEKLEQEGYVTRQAVKGDKRSLYVILTPRGKQILKDIQAVMVWENELVFAGFTQKDIVLFEALLARMEANIQSEA